MKALWGGRFKKEMDERLKEFSYSLATDHELFEAELRVNEAHAKMLAKIGIIKKAEARRIAQGLAAVGKGWSRGTEWRFFKRYEDIHTLIQDQLEKKVGPVAKKIHTGRSRNDLVITSTRLYLKERLAEIIAGVAQTQSALLACAKKADELMIPGMTHLRKAQPILVAHHFLAYVEMLGEDCERLTDAKGRIDVLPLGAAALAGSALPLDQHALAKELGFSKIAANSLAAVSDRAFLVEVMSGLSILWMHLSRLAEDLILWNSEPFNFIEIDDAFATGSSLMPQKKNPDIFELIRGRSAAVFGELISLLILQKGLPLSYNRDLQEDKPAVFDAIRKTLLVLKILPPVLTSISFKRKSMDLALADDGLYATDLLEYLVRKNIPFAEAHQTVGRVVGYALETDKPLRKLAIREWKKFSKAFGPDIYDLFDPKASVRGKKTIGSTHPDRVRAEIRKWEKNLAV